MTWPKSSFQPLIITPALKKDSKNNRLFQEHSQVPKKPQNLKAISKPRIKKQTNKQTSKPHSISLFRRGADEMWLSIVLLQTPPEIRISDTAILTSLIVTPGLHLYCHNYFHECVKIHSEIAEVPYIFFL